MNAPAKLNYVEVPSPSTILRVQLNPAPKTSAITGTLPFDAVKHLLSKKPLRRPERLKSHT